MKQYIIQATLHYGQATGFLVTAAKVEQAKEKVRAHLKCSTNAPNWTIKGRALVATAADVKLFAEHPGSILN